MSKFDIYNPCDDGIPAKIWELLRRNEYFRRDSESLLKIEKKLEQKEFIRYRKHRFAVIALRWSLPPYYLEEVTKSSGLSNKRGKKSKPGPKLYYAEGDDIDLRKEYKEDCRNGFAPLTVGHAWPKTPRGFRRKLARAWNDSTNHPFEINQSEITPGMGPDPDEEEPAISIFWQITYNTHRIFAIPHKPQVSKSSKDRKRLIGWFKERLDEQTLPHVNSIFGTFGSWEFYLLTEKYKSEGLSLKKAKVEAILDLNNVDSITRGMPKAVRSIYGEKIGRANCQYRSIDNKRSPEGWIQKIYPMFPGILDF